jgi:hypothetical protein
MRTTIALVATFLTTVATLLAQLEGDDELWRRQRSRRFWPTSTEPRARSVS